jgi:outer membrane lipoprotein-sorting protein
MKTLIISSLLLFGLTGAVSSQQPDPKDIVRRANDLMMGRSSRSAATMTVVRPTWSRKVTMKTWSLGTDYYMILITGPAQDKGQVFLKRFSEMWNWMPSISRIIRIPPSMMGQNWMGSDFTNNDLVKMNSIVDDYEHRLIGTETRQGYDCYKIELTPHPDAAVVWDKIIMWIAKDKYFLLQAEYYNEDGELVNREVQSDIRHFDDRDLPAKMVMTPVMEKGKQTIFEFHELDFNLSLKPEFFSQQNMKNIH